jgi:hypothetical protein
VRRRVLLSLLAASIVAVAFGSASGAATARAQKGASTDVSTRAAVLQYLRSLHINPTGVVVQRGLRNYAGMHCPGKGWTCTRTTHPVVQVAKLGGRNTFRCTTRRCAVVQVAPHALTPNTAKCVKASGLTQSCVISQTSSSASNVAIVYENAKSSSGLTQAASATASITQKATGAGANTACVYQNIELDNSTVAKKGSTVTVTSEAHQTVTIKQNSASGANAAAQSATSGGACTGSSLAQTQTLKSVANGSGSITQNQNAASKGPNVSLDIEQNQSSGFMGSATGANSVVFNQTSNLQAVANTPKGPVSQTQSSPDTDLPFSGLVGTVNQDSQGVSTASVMQTETQCEDAATSGLSSCHTAPGNADFDGTYALHQTQYGPEGIFKAPKVGQGPVHFVHKGVGTATQTGNSGDTFTIDQSSQQDDDQGPGSQQTNVVQGDCSTPGICTTTQQTTVNGSTTQDTQSGQNVSSSIDCTGSVCTATSPPIPTITDGPPNPSDSSDASFSFTDTDPTVTFECQLDDGAYEDCTSPATYGDLADGQHTFNVKAKNTTGQESDPASYTWTISTGPSPVTVLQLNPATDPEGGTCGHSFASGTGFDGTPTMVPETVDLSQFDGQAIQLRFAFSTGDAQFNDYEGWYVNNIQVTGMEGDSPVSVFSDPVADGDTTFTASSDFGVAPGWHVSDRRNADLGGPAWWYGNEATGSYQSPDPIDNCQDSSANAGTITSPVFTLASNSELSFDTLWQIEGVNPSSFDLMDVQVIPASIIEVAPKMPATKRRSNS